MTGIKMFGENYSEYPLFFHEELFKGGRDFNGWGWDAERKRCIYEYFEREGFFRSLRVLQRYGTDPKQAKRNFLRLGASTPGLIIPKDAGPQAYREFVGPGFDRLRTTVKDGEIWLVTADVCRALEISNSRDAMTRLDDDEKDDVGLSDTIGREQQMTIINEPGLYSVSQLTLN